MEERVLFHLFYLKEEIKKIFSIHIQDPKVNFKNFDVIVAPEHDNLKGDNVLDQKVQYII